MFILAWVFALFYTSGNNIVDYWCEVIIKTLKYPGWNFIYFLVFKCFRQLLTCPIDGSGGVVFLSSRSI